MHAKISEKSYRVAMADALHHRLPALTARTTEPVQPFSGASLVLLWCFSLNRRPIGAVSLIAIRAKSHVSVARQIARCWQHDSQHRFIQEKRVEDADKFRI